MLWVSHMPLLLLLCVQQHVGLVTSVPVAGRPATGSNAATRPNLLLLFPDQWRWDFNELILGEPVIKTPTFASVARRGSLFERAYVPSPLCAPSRAALALGREYDHQQVPSNSYDVPPGVSTFYRALRDDAKCLLQSTRIASVCPSLRVSTCLCRYVLHM